MPEKDGADDKKTTKEVVSKKQKQMMGEEGYDHLRDMGKIRPSKNRKDATTMPVSDEVKKTQKKNKGPSALERVKKKYKGQIMDVKKEELDLTQVAEAFGGYIIESSFDNLFQRQNQNQTNSKSKPTVTTGQGRVVKPKKPKRGSTAMSGQRNIFTNKPEEVKVKTTYNTSGKSRKTKSEAEGQLKIPGMDTSKKATKTKEVAQKPPEKLLQKITRTTELPKFKMGSPEQAAADQAFKDMRMSGEPKFTDTTKDVKKGMRNVAMGRDADYVKKRRAKRATPKQLEKTRAQVAKVDAKEKAKMYKSPETGRMTRRTKSLRDTSIGIADRRIKVVAQKTKQMAAKGAQAAVAKVRTAPLPTAVGAAVIAGTVRDMFRGMPKIPAPPKVKGGTVGRRTAG